MRRKVFQGKICKRQINRVPVVLTPRVSTARVQVNSILRNVAGKLNYDNEQLEDLYERTAWRLEESSKLPGSSYEVFKKAAV